ncbi:MAG TPA: pyruvate formate lyase family protein [Armatimonadota bacterium]|nr:pyruvate formate lyase family protein [Armatimonadota bacterium]HOS42329.1 pyruvate formate lyase family protein [Armatimonadota bacterium]
MTYEQRLDRLRARKLAQTREKLARLGAQDEDDYGNVPPPAEFRWTPPCADADGAFHGAAAWGKNFRDLLEHHPVYLDPDDALAGRWMFMLSRMRPNYRLSQSPFPFDYAHLREEQARYDITSGIGKDAHFAPDYRIGLALGWGGLAEKVRRARRAHAGDPEAEELLDAELDALAGIRSWMRRTAEAARALAEAADDPARRRNLAELAAINFRLLDAPPHTFREACQWLAWFNMASRTYNRDGAGGQLDALLAPYYEADLAAGRLDEEAAIFYLACLLLNDPHYYQIGGPDRDGRDQTSPVSFLILEAAHRLKVSCNLTIRVFDGMDARLFRRGLEVLFQDRLGYPRFSGDRALVAGFMRNGFDAATARERIALGCNWMSLPGREYTLNDLVKINLAKVFEVALHETFSGDAPSTGAVMTRFETHLRRAVQCAAAGIDFHLRHQYRNEPELLLNLLSHGPIERGRDASHGGVEWYNLGIDGAGLAVVADSFAAIEQWIERERRMSWDALRDALAHNFAGAERERIRRRLARSERYGHGRSLGDKWAGEITACFTRLVKSAPTPPGRVLIPGWFSWADTVRFGTTVGATPNGRFAGAPISHGANPNPGFRRDGALTALVKAVARVQPGYGNTAPLQLEIDPGLAGSARAMEAVGRLLQAHFALGGTLVNINIVDAETLRAAHRGPERYPDLLVRVTGFSAYFSRLSPEFRQLVVERIIGMEDS